MFGRIMLFELRYQLRRPAFFVSFGIFAALAFGIATGVGMLSVGKGQIDDPTLIKFIVGAFSSLGMFVPLALIADVALRDSESRMDELVRSAPVPMTSYVLAKFIGAFLVVCLAFMGAVIGLAIGSRMWWLDPSKIGPFRLDAYAAAVAILALPNLFVAGALFFALATLTRSLFATYVGVLLFPALWATTVALLFEPAYRPVAGLIEPGGMVADVVGTMYWTIAERRSGAIPFGGLLLWNRVLWVAVAIVVLALAIALFRRRERAGRPFRVEAADVSPAIVVRQRPIAPQGGAGWWTQLRVRTRYEVGGILRGWAFLALLALAALGCTGALIMLGRQYGTSLLPVTSVVAPAVADACNLFVTIAAVLFGAELVWRERETRMSEIIDATPASNLVFLASKLLALALALATLLAVVMATGIGFQLAKGITQIELDFYVVSLFVLTGSSMLMIGVLSFFVQTVVNNKYVGLLVTLVLVLGTSIAAAALGLKNRLLIFAEYPRVPLSDLNRYGHFLSAALWYLAYWGCVTVLLGVATHLLWVRGVTAPLVARVRGARRSLTPAVASVAILALVAGAALGGYIYRNTDTIDPTSAMKDLEQWRVDYERAYRRFETLPQPRVTEVEMAVDLQPESRGYSSRGTYGLLNRSDTPIELVRVQFNVKVKVDKVELTDADLVEREPRINHFVFRPRVPMAPGATLTLTFAASAKHAGLEEGDDPSFVVHNGTFVNNSELAPSIGVLRGIFLQDEKRRRAYGLEPLGGSATSDDKSQYQRNYIRGDSDFVRFAIALSTSADQTAVAPGYLQREWTDGGRRFFRYEMDSPILNFWSVVSARYAVARDRWNEVDIAVYHHPAHGMNVPRMIEAVKAALAYCSANFGPYQHRQLRIVEFPGYATFAQSFPNTVPYSETFGFLVDNRDPESIDYVWNVTAHEVAHQWWAHQVIGANVPGATFLSETLAEYSALMVMEQRYGSEKMRQYLKYELDTYLQSRGQEGSEEEPLARVRPYQQYIHYKKGALAMYALKDAIGEAAVNRALARLVRQYAYKTDPYPTSADLIRLLRAEAGRQHQQLVTDLFEKIVLWDLAVTGSDATATEDGQWRVRIDVRARKLEADGKGQEKEAPLDQAIEVGLFMANPDRPEFTAKDVIRLEKRPIKTGKQTIEFMSDRKPTFVGINPYLKLIERNIGDNVAPLGR